MLIRLQAVFSTYVEMIPNISADKINTGSILHVCGDDPELPMIKQEQA